MNTENMNKVLTPSIQQLPFMCTEHVHTVW